MAGKGPPKGPRLTVDAWIEDGERRVLLVRRARPPFRGRWSLPGGFCEWGETTEDACRREVREETGLDVRIGSVLGVYSDPKRDPRGHTVSVLYQARPVGGVVEGGDDAAEARWFAVQQLPGLDLAFDHGEIVREQLARRRGAGRRPTGRGGGGPRPRPVRSRRARLGAVRE